MVVVDLKDQHAPPAFLRHPGSHRGLHVSAVNKLAVARIAGWRCALARTRCVGAASHEAAVVLAAVVVEGDTHVDLGLGEAGGMNGRHCALGALEVACRGPDVAHYIVVVDRPDNTVDLRVHKNKTVVEIRPKADSAERIAAGRGRGV